MIECSIVSNAFERSNSTHTLFEKERTDMQKIKKEYQEWKIRREQEKAEIRRKKKKERLKKKEEKKETLKLGEDERTIPPGYRSSMETPEKKLPIHLRPLTEERQQELREHYNSTMGYP